jgi:probable rRNA maturation factor
VTRRAVIEAPGPLVGFPGVRRFRRDLARLARLVAADSRRGVDVSVAVVSDREIRRLHRRWLRRDRATDVVSWPLSGPEDPVLRGCVAVSRDTAAREAARRGHSPYHELVLYVVHGVLHLEGHDDHAAAARERMRRAERERLAALGLPSVFESGEGRRGRGTRRPKARRRTT